MDLLASAYGGDFTDADALVVDQPQQATNGTRTGTLDDIEHDDEEPSRSASLPFSTSFQTSTALSISAAPPVITDAEKAQYLHDPRARVVNHNTRVGDMWAPVVGPTQPGMSAVNESSMKNCWTGHVEPSHIDDYTFQQEYQRFYTQGVTSDPSGAQVDEYGRPRLVHAASRKAWFGDEVLPGEASSGGNSPQHTGADAAEGDNKTRSSSSSSAVAGSKRKRSSKGKEAAEESGGEEAHADEQSASSKRKASKRKGQSKTKGQIAEGGQQEGDSDEEAEEDDESTGSGAAACKKSGVGKERSILHKKPLYDYQGRTFVDTPSQLRHRLGQVPDAFLPKKRVHTYAGHTKGVSQIRFFPKSAHLLLSASMDSKVKIWDVYDDRRCVRTYLGHEEYVRDISFNHDGRQFLSASMDRQVKLWDTETGQCLGNFSKGRVPICVRFNPDPEYHHEFLCGQGDHKVVQWDTRTKEVVQEYDRHLEAVNTVSFVGDKGRFVTTSSDKTIRVWEYGIPVEVKIVSEPHMHSMPSCAVHPSGKWWVGQSQDNQILVYHCRDRFRLNSKKRFRGHEVAGFAAQISFSPDGKYIISGDGTGKLFIWDWKSTRVYKTIEAHTQVCIGALWNPLQTSGIATCSWDASIKYW
eukprot:CAMPEP_0174241040 /NCGR_PEP_ID=MMETSP0417-20130205/21547_1 /TAXON_ID=242541 /ORGANISM="Mayorella sp, Strain BSH-02190019" /LENGTH=637 /DNA_ID=CAMNT_0015320229 /DNA_START=16 /DNA_END=1926 /DNA_ORIENTATION=+